ncbi:MAG: hypothetical protein WA549_01580 [Thermoplasmata archaeon]
MAFETFDGTLRQANTWFVESLNGTDGVKLRGAAYAVIDYYKQILDAGIIGASLHFEESANIQTKFRTLRDRLPKLESWASIANLVEHLRNRVHHTEIGPVPQTDVQKLIESAPSFLSALRLELDRRNSGLSKVELLDEELGAIEGDVARLRALPSTYLVPLEGVESRAMDLTEVYDNLILLRDWIKRLDPARIPRLLVVTQWCARHVSQIVLDAENEAYNMDELARMEGEVEESRREEEHRSREGS